MPARGPLDRPLTRAERARYRLAAASRRGDPPECIEEARADLAEANLAARIREVVDGAPPLSPVRRDRLALLLCPGHVMAEDHPHPGPGRSGAGRRTARALPPDEGKPP
jgi:hypothetical protein